MVSALGFGAMRLPQKSPEPADIDLELSVRMIRMAIDAGVNYVDTAYGYHAKQSEVVVGKALAGGYRQKVKLATKLPTWLVKTADDFDLLLGEQLGKLGVEHIDYYLLHALDANRWPNMLKLGILERAEKARRDGRIGALGFSYHDELPLFKKIVDAHDWTFCQIQYNFMDTTFQAGTEGLKYAHAKGLAVAVMEPLRGGQLAMPLPPAVGQVWKKSSLAASHVERALQWVWDQPEVAVVLSGMSDFQQVVENLASAERSGINHLSRAERSLFLEARAAYESKKSVPCTRCFYCMPCPHGVDIPRNFQLFNDAQVYGNPAGPQRTYKLFMSAESRAESCTACGECLPKCPQHIAIPDRLAEVPALLGESAPKG